MSNRAITVRELAKEYRIGQRVERYATLRDSVSASVSNVFGSLRGRSRSDAGPSTMWALEDVSFDIDYGEVVGIVGPNGAGKSTILKILSRITPPTRGWADVNGRIGCLLEVGTGFHPELTGRENIYLNGAVLGMRRAEINACFDDIVAFSEIEDFIETPVKRYSSGMYTRLAFAVAAHLRSDILVVDEVLAVGDIGFQKKCLERMESIGREGRAVLFVSHNLSAITRLCTRAFLLDGGRTVLDGDPDSVADAYLRRTAGGRGMTWDTETAPGNDQIKLRFVRPVDASGKEISLANVSDAVTIEVGYQVLDPDIPFRVSVAVATRGTIAFTAVEPVESTRDCPGLHVSRVHVPGHLLTEGEYTLSAALFHSTAFKQVLASAKDAAAFQVHDPVDGTSARGDYVERMKGVVRPKLDWSQEFISDVVNEPSEEAVCAAS